MPLYATRDCRCVTPGDDSVGESDKIQLWRFDPALADSSRFSIDRPERSDIGLWSNVDDNPALVSLGYVPLGAYFPAIPFMCESSICEIDEKAFRIVPETPYSRREIERREEFLKSVYG